MEKHYVEFYDEKDITLNAHKRANSVLININKFHPRAKKILELGVGTGDVMKFFPKKYTLGGLDIDKKSIEFAKKNIPHVSLFLSSMHNFKSDKQDVIFSIFDSMNYLANFTKWKQTFKTVSDHLNEDGLFIFDMYLLNIIRFSNPRFLFLEESSGYYFDKVVSSGSCLHWKSTIFESIEKDTYKRRFIKWTERIYPPTRVEKEVKKYFKILHKYDAETSGKQNSKTRRMIYITQLK